MVRVRHVPRGLLVPAALVVLVAALATLQYRWLGKVSEAEREQLRRSLDQRAREFVDDFDGEITHAYVALHLSDAEMAANDWERFGLAVDRWRNAARFPAMVREILLAQVTGGGWIVRRYDPQARAFGPATATWPADLETIRAHLAAEKAPTVEREGQFQRLSVTMTPVAPAVPALLAPVGAALPTLPQQASAGGPGVASRDAGARGAVAARFWLRWPGAFVVASLDEEVLRRSVLPALVARHLPDGADSYRVVILSASGQPVFARGLAPGTSIDLARADSVSPFFGLRLDVLHAVESGPANLTFRTRVAGEGSGEVGPVAGSPRMAIVVERRDEGGPVAHATSATRRFPSWRLVLQHPAGSLDAAVTQARRRNLWLGGGILGVLLAGVALVVLNGRRASQLAARQMEFVTTVSHELRTPLAVIRSAAQNLSAGVVSEPAQARRYGELIEDEGRRLTEMVEEILEYSRVHGDRPIRNPQPLDVALLLADLRVSCEPLCTRAGITLEVETPPAGTPPIFGDEAAVRRAIHNLVANAVKHAVEGRWIGVSAIPAVIRGRGHVAVTVRDRGPGIAPADLSHLFEPFYRGRLAIERQVHGNGLGLSLVKRVADAHGGSVTVTSAPGQGSTFTLTLPAATGASPVVEVES
jgi:signal transduction histidine kinase